GGRERGVEGASSARGCEHVGEVFLQASGGLWVRRRAWREREPVLARAKPENMRPSLPALEAGEAPASGNRQRQFRVPPGEYPPASPSASLSAPRAARAESSR